MKNKILMFTLFGFGILVLGYFLLGCGEAPKTYKVGDLNLAISISPNPPKAGDNNLKIKLLDESQKVIKDAEVKVTYSMPAMGNMSAMRSDIKAKIAGDSYKVSLSLAMLGTWNLAIEIVRPGSAPVVGKFKLTTDQKGIMFVPGRSRGKKMKMDMQMNMEKPKGPVVELTEEQEKLIGVKTEAVTMLPLFKEIRTVGVVAYDPVLVVAQEEFVAALEAQDNILKSGMDEIANNSTSLVGSSKRKLRILGLSLAQIKDLEKNRRVDSNLLLPEKKMWVYADIYEYELDGVKIGQRAQIKSVAYPEKIFYGVVKALDPILEAKTRSNRVRILVNNYGLKLKPQMYVDVYLKSSPKYTLAVPKAAVLDTGIRKLAYVDHGNGIYEAREVVTGAERNALIKGIKRKFLPLVKGLSKGEMVVVAANFLIDSQRQLTGGSSALYGGAEEVIDD